MLSKRVPMVSRAIHTIARAPSAAISATEQGVLVYDSHEFKCKTMLINSVYRA